MQAGPSEIAKAAQSLCELSELWQPEEELSGIDLIEQDQRVLVRRINLLIFVGPEYMLTLDSRENNLASLIVTWCIPKILGG